MTRILSFIAAATLLAAAPASAAELSVTTHTATPAGFSVNSHLIQGERDAILVDTQFTRSEAVQAVEMVKRSGKRLRYVFVTHGHPDHFFHLELFQQAFPDARIVAPKSVIPDIEAYGPRAIAMWKPSFGDEIPDSFVIPEPLGSTSLFLEGQEIQLIQMDGGESAHAVVLWIPSTKALFTGDLAYNKVHLWLRENRPKGWLEILERLAQLRPQTIYPGHGPAGGPELLAANRAYIEAFIEATAAPATKEQAIAKLTASYPDYALPVIVEFSVGGRLGI